MPRGRAQRVEALAVMVTCTEQHRRNAKRAGRSSNLGNHTVQHHLRKEEM
jgi:hypothetical protein